MVRDPLEDSADLLKGWMDMIEMDMYNQEYSKLETLEDSIKEELVDAICHGIVVSNLSVLLARELGEDEAFCREIAIAGLLHDIGKIKMNRYLYGKDAMAVEEMKYFRMHSVYSYDVLRKKQYSAFVQQTVYHHHENYDGSGYPENLVGEDIPYGARILHVCDVFAALTSNRTYRTAFDRDTAIQVMFDEAKNFDIKILIAFQRLLHSEQLLDRIYLEDIPEMTEKFTNYLFKREKLEIVKKQEVILALD